MNEVLREELANALVNLVDVIDRMQIDNINAAFEEMKPPEPQGNETFTPDGAAEYLRCSRGKIYKMKRDGELEFHTTGSRIYFKKKHLDEWMEKGGSKACAES